MVHILCGADSFSLKERLQEIISRLGDMEMLDLNTQRLDGAAISAAQFANTCNAMPFMGSRRLVIVEGLLSRFNPTVNPPGAVQTKEDKQPQILSELKAGVSQGNPQEQPRKGWLPFASIIRTTPESTVLVLVDAEIRNNNPLLSELATVIKVESFPFLKEEELFRWVQKRAAKYGASLSPDIIHHLISLIGNNLWVIDSELQKLLLFAGDSPIKLSDVEQVVGYSRENNIFQLVDAILQRHIKRALEILHQLRSAGAEPAYILVMLTREIRRMLLAKCISAGKVPAPELARELRLYAEKDLRIITGKAKRYSQASLEDLYHKILRTDIIIKTGKLDAGAAVEFLIGQICEATLERAVQRE